MIHPFFKDDFGYEDWFAKNPEGFVLNVNEEKVNNPGRIEPVFR